MFDPLDSIGRKPGGNGHHPFASLWWLGVAALLLLCLTFFFLVPAPTSSTPATQMNLSYSAFLTQVQANNVKTARLSSNTASGLFNKPYVDPVSGQSYPGYTTTLLPIADPGLVPLLIQHHVQLMGDDQTPPPWLQMLGPLLPALLVLLVFGLVYAVMGARSRRGPRGISSVGQSHARLYTEERPSTAFADVAGVETAKSELSQEVDFLRDPTKYQRLGAKIPKGVLLVGPPGTGKTLLARAVAGEARVPFFSISATEFVEVFVGVGASRVRDLFEKAKMTAPAIIFIDEIDAIGRQRGSGGPLGGGTNDEREQTLNQMLVSMDGFEPNQTVIVLAATNRPDVLDHALLRPGRFDRQVTVDPPDRRGREAILRVHARDIPLAPEVSLAALAQATPGMSGADLANLANEAALTAARKRESCVSAADFEEALDRITLGAEGAALMNEEERRTVAYHEGGHALVACLLPNVDPVHRVTITPRGRSLGVTQFRPLDDRRNYRRDYLLARMAVGLGGRSAEEIAATDITSGAQNDLQQVTQMARAMVTQMGMADELGHEYFGGSGDDALGGRPYNPWEPKEYSEATAGRIDVAVARLIDEAHECARRLLEQHRVTLDRIAAALMEEESLTREQLLAIVQAKGDDATLPAAATAASPQEGAPPDPERSRSAPVPAIATTDAGSTGAANSRLLSS